MKRYFAGIIAVGFATLVQPGCALVGNVKPVEEKSSSYGVMDLSKASSDWQMLRYGDNSGKDGSAPDQMADVAYQSKKTASIISLDSACRTGAGDVSEQSLRQLTDQLIQGITNISLREEAKGTLHGDPILQTTVSGKSDGETISLRAVVLQKDKCVYDLMYVARPQHFREDEDYFTKFVDSLKVK